MYGVVAAKNGGGGGGQGAFIFFLKSQRLYQAQSAPQGLIE